MELDIAKLLGFKNESSAVPEIARGLKYYYARARFYSANKLKTYKKLKSFILTGIPVDLAISEIFSVYVEEKPRHVYVTVLGDIQYSLSALGNPLSIALKKWVPPGDVMLLHSGTSSDSGSGLTKALDSLIEQTESYMKIIKGLAAVLVYPTILMIMAIAVMIYFSTSVIPNIADSSDPTNWSEGTKTFIAFVSFVGSYYPIIIAAILVLVFSVIISFPLLTGTTRKLLDYLLPWSLYRQVQGAVFLNALSGMMKSGIDIMRGLEGLREHANPYMSDHLRLMTRALRAGRSPGESMDTGLFDFETRADLVIFGRTLDFSEAMKELSKESINNVIDLSKAIGHTLNVAMLLCISTFVITTIMNLMDMMDISSGGLLQ